MENEWTKQHTLTAALIRCSHQLPFFKVRLIHRTVSATEEATLVMAGPRI